MAAEAQQQTPPQEARSFLQKAAEVGQQRLEVKAQKRSERWAGFRERVTGARDAVAQGFRKAGETVSTIWKLQEAVPDPGLRSEAAHIIGEKVSAGAEAVGDKIVDIRDAALDAGERAVNATQDSLRAVARKTKENVLQPALQGADRARKAVVNGALNGTLFTVGLAVGAVEGGIAGGKAVVNAAKETAATAVDMGVAGMKAGAEFVGDRVDDAVLKANEVRIAATEQARVWGENVSNYYRDTTDTLNRDFTSRRLDVSAGWNRFLASVSEKRANFREYRANRREQQILRKQELLTNLQQKASSSREMANQKNALALERQSAAAQLRSSS